MALPYISGTVDSPLLTYVDGDGFHYHYTGAPFFTDDGGHRLWSVPKARSQVNAIALVDQSGDSPFTVDDASRHGALLVDVEGRRKMQVVFPDPGMAMVVPGDEKPYYEVTGEPKPAVRLPLVSDRHGDELQATVSLATAAAVTTVTGARVYLGDMAFATPEPSPDTPLRELAATVSFAQNGVNFTALAGTLASLSRALLRRTNATAAVPDHALVRCMMSKLASMVAEPETYDWEEMRRLAEGDLDGLDELAEIVADTK